jgi:hypothetical protein
MFGVYGETSTGTGVYGTGVVFGVAGTGQRGVQGDGSFDGVDGISTSTTNGAGIYGEATAPAFAGYFAGKVTITGNVTIFGTLSKPAGSFKIDHPLHPATQYLQHSFVESPDMLDVYNGNVVTDGNGFATVKLPDYFQALNRSFRYQLTSLSGLQEVAVAKEIENNRFTIQSERPNSKVSWQVTGIRHDRYANAHRIQVVVPKSGADTGKYLNPELYGKAKTAAIGYRPIPKAPVQR